MPSGRRREPRAVTAQAVARRRREIAIRLALGAQPRAAVLLFVREALWVCGLGVAIGLGASAAIAGALRSMLFGIGAADLPTYAGAIVLFAIVALVATVVPARRAAVVEPSSGLRQE